MSLLEYMDQFNRSLESEIVVEGILKDVLSRIYSNEDEKIEKEKAEEDKKRLELEIEEEKKLKEREERLKQREEENSDDSDYDEDDENCPIINVNTVPNFGTDSQGEEEEEPKRKEAEKEHQEDNMTSQENQGDSLSGIRISTAVSLLLSAETPSSVEEESSLPRAESDPTPAAPADDIRSIDITPVDNRDEQGINNLLDIDSPLSPEDSSSRNHNCNPNDGVNEANPDMEDPSDGVDPLALGDNEEAVAEGLSIDNIWTVNVEDSPAGEQPPTIEEEQTIMDPTVDSETTASALAVPSLGLRLKNFAVDPTVSVSGDVLPSSVPTVSSSWHTADPSSAQPAPRSPVPIRPLPQQPQRPLQIVTSTVGSPTIMIHHQPSPQPNISMTVQQPPPQTSMAQFYVPDPAPTMQQYLQPAAQQQHQQQFVVPPNVTLPSQPLPVMRPGVPTFTAFKNALDSLEIRTVIKGAQKCACTYMIFSSSENITLRLFIPASKLHVLPQQSEEWSRVQYQFHPDLSKPEFVNFIFPHQRRGPNQSSFTITAKLPVSDNEALRFVDNAEIFALSPARVHIINKNCLEKFREPFLSYAYHRLKNQVLVVSKVTEKEIEVGEAFYHLGNPANPIIPLTQDDRVTSVQHLNLLLQHHKIPNHSGEDLERRIFQKAKGETNIYRQLLRSGISGILDHASNSLPAGQQFNVTGGISSSNAAGSVRPVQSVQPQPHFSVKCLFCSLTFEQLRGTDYLRHVAVFHMPTLNERQACDVDNCSVMFSSRTEHLLHISSHTKDNETFFRKGLFQLHTYFARSDVVSYMSSIANVGGGQGKYCQFCKKAQNGWESFLIHLTLVHFMDVILDNLPRNGTNIKCTFPQCNRIFPFPMAGVVHLGVEHGVAKSLMDLKTHDLSQVVSRPLNCPLKSCKYAFKDKKDLLRHLNAHFESHMSNEISKLQEIQFVPRTHCPCSGCNYSTEGIVKDDSLVVNELLLDHYAGVHGASIDILRSLDEKVIRPEINLQTMAELIPDRSSTPLKCPKCLKKKGKTMFYCDESAWLLHISSCHEQEDLKRMEAMYFHTNQPETAAKCKICDKVVAPKLRFLHIGVHHIHAKSLTQRFMKAEDAKMQKQRTLQGTGDGGGVSQTVPSLQGTAVGAQKSFPPMYFQCPKCSSKIFSSTETESRKVLLRHIILIHYLDELTALVSGKFPRCPVLGCEYSANSETELRKHFLTHLDKVLQVIQVKIRDFSFESCLRKLPENENKDDDDEVVVLDDSASGPSITSVTSLAPAAGMAPTTPSQTTEKEAISKRVKIVYQEFASYCHDKRVTMKTCVPTDLTSFLDKHFLTDDKTIDQYSSRVLTGFIFIVDQLLDKDEHGNSFSSNRLVAASITGVKKAINYKLSGNHHNNSAAETAATPNSDSSSRDGKSKKPQEDLFLCDHCQGRFSSVGKLKMHMFMIKLFNIKVSCVFCSGSNGFCVQGPWEKLEESCSLHIVSRSHQFNRCLKLQSGGGPMQENFRKPGLDGFCEACAEAVNGWHEHKTTKKHKDNVREVDSFVEYCNFRGISSVTCAVSDVKFYLDFVYPRTLQHSDVNIHQILFILSRIHDPVDGNDLYCINEINSHLQGLMRQTDPKRFSFICYSCPAGFNDMTELMKHASSLGHKSIVKTRSQRSFKNFFNCLACKRHFDSVLLMKIHEHERCHVKNSYFYSRNFDRFQREVEDRDDSLCTLCGVRCRGESHFNEEPHKSYQPLAENYIKYCLEKNKEPTSCGADFVETYFKTIVYSSPRLAQEASSTMSILNRLHDPIENDITIGKSPRFQALVESLKKMKQKPSIQSSSNRSSSSSRENREDKKTEKRPPYEESLSLEVADKLTRCLKCNEKFEHVTGLLYHLTKVHNSKAISHIIQFHNKGEEVHCEKCTKKCLSPIVYALHHDRHHLSSEFIKCPTCQYSYVSPSNFYYKDFCGDNNLSKEVKKEIESAITNLTMSGGSKPLGSCLMANLKKAAASGSLKRPRQELEDDYFSVEENIASSSPTKKRSKIKKVRSRGFLESSDEDEEIKEGDDDYIPNMEEDVDDPEPFEGDEEEEDGVENTNELPISKFGRKDRKLTRRDYPKVAISKALRDQAEKALNQDLRLTVSNNSSSSSPAINVPSSAVVQDEFVPDPPPAKRQRTISSSSSVSNASSRASKRASRPPVAANPPVVPRLVSPEKSKPSSMKVEKPSRASSVSSVKSENNASSSVKPEVSDATPAVKSEPSSSSGKPVAKPDLLFFCLDCEGCKDKSCNHRSHPRVFVGDQAAVKAHIRETMHTRLQTAKDFLQLGKTVSLKDLAYCQTYGHKVRKQFKKGVTTNMIEARRYPEKRQCKWKNCQYMADNVVTAFRHIRNEHLITKVKGEKDE